MALGLPVLAATWVLVLVLATVVRRTTLPAATLSVELAVLVAVALAAAAACWRRGDPEPGRLVAPLLVLAGASVLVVAGALGVDPSLSGRAPGGGSQVTVAWGVTGAVAVG
ncbi:MAG: hypothetical protein WB798_02730, partial [Nocardioidaceae bacterium]